MSEQKLQYLLVILSLVLNVVIENVFFLNSVEGSNKKPFEQNTKSFERIS